MPCAGYHRCLVPPLRAMAAAPQADVEAFMKAVADGDWSALDNEPLKALRGNRDVIKQAVSKKWQALQHLKE